MATSIGSKIQNVLVGILIALLVLAFAVWGINDVFSPSSRTAVLSVGDEEVTTQEFESAFRRQLTVMTQTDGRQLPHQEAYDRGIHRQVLQNLLGKKIIEIDANDLGIGVNSKSAREYISDIDAFHDELTGKFSETKLMETLSYQRPPVTRYQFEQDLIHSLRQEQTIPAINGGVVAPLKFAEQRYRYLTEQRKARVLTLNAVAVPPAPEPTDEELQDYIAQNTIRFTAPEYRRVTMIRLEEADMIPDLEIDPAEVQDYFEYKVELGELGSAETRSLAQITAPDEATAQTAADRLANGEDPETVAALMSLIAPITYENVSASAILDPQTAEAAFQMTTGEARAIEGSLGTWYAIVVSQINEAIEPDIETVRAELEAEILTNKAQERLYEITPAIEDVLDTGGTLQEAAEAAGVPYVSIDFVDRSGATQDDRRMLGIDGLEGIAEDENIMTEIFTNDVGFPTDMFQTSTGGWAALQVEDIIESQLRPFEEVKNQATILWKTQKVNEALDDLMLDLAGRLEDGETLDALLAEISNGATLEEHIIVRASPGRDIGPVVVAGLLDAQVGDIERGPGPTPLTRQIAVLTEITANMDGLAGEYADLLQQQATAAILSDLNQAYQAAVLKDNPLREYPEKVRTTLGLDTSDTIQ